MKNLPQKLKEFENFMGDKKFFCSNEVRIVLNLLFSTAIIILLQYRAGALMSKGVPKLNVMCGKVLSL